MGGGGSGFGEGCKDTLQSETLKKPTLNSNPNPKAMYRSDAASLRSHGPSLGCAGVQDLGALAQALNILNLGIYGCGI